MLAPKYGVAYAVPPGWKVQRPEWVSYVQGPDEQVLAGESAVATSKRGRCTRPQTGAWTRSPGRPTTI